MAMALGLHSLSIPCTVYELRQSETGSRTAGGGMMIGGNSLRILDSWGVYEKMLPRGYSFDVVHYKDAGGKTVDRYPFGNKGIFGYDGLRIYRQQFLECLYETCREKGIRIEFGAKFVRVVEETAAGVTFELGDGSTRTAALLIGADGIHSKVRQYINPGVSAAFVGTMAVTYEVAASQLRVPEDYDFPVQVTTATGSFVLAPQTPDGSLMLAGRQFPTQDRTREEWAALLADREGLISLLRQDMASWPDTVRSALEYINPDTLHVWPFYRLPRLAEGWTSAPHRRVVILGDAAHAVPPTTGQGASMGIEDAYALGLLISAQRAAPALGWADALGFWQAMRQRRLDAVLELTRVLNNKRLPSGEQAKLKPGDVWVDESAGNPRQMAWLYEPEIEKEVEAWVRDTGKGEGE